MIPPRYPRPQGLERLSPAVRRLLHEHGLDPRTVTPDAGRLTRRRLEEFLAAPDARSVPNGAVVASDARAAAAQTRIVVTEAVELPRVIDRIVYTVLQARGGRVATVTLVPLDRGDDITFAPGPDIRQLLAAGQPTAAGEMVTVSFGGPGPVHLHTFPRPGEVHVNLCGPTHEVVTAESTGNVGFAVRPVLHLTVTADDSVLPPRQLVKLFAALEQAVANTTSAYPSAPSTS
jgi:e3 binding domain